MKCKPLADVIRRQNQDRGHRVLIADDGSVRVKFGCEGTWRIGLDQ